MDSGPDELIEAQLRVTDQASSLVRAATHFAARRHAGQRRGSDGAPFIAHPAEVAQLLSDVGCADVVIAAGLLHDVLEDTETTPGELTVQFGGTVAGLVRAVSDDPSVEDYRERKQRLREQVEQAGGDSIPLFAADKISKVRELSVSLRAQHARGAGSGGLRHHHRLRLEHYHESQRMLKRVAAEHPLVRRLVDELHNCPSRPSRPRDSMNGR